MHTDKWYLWHMAEAVEYDTAVSYWGYGYGYGYDCGAGKFYTHVESRMMDVEVYRIGYVY
jgi:starvation-inducible outer membrane lipoprotein